MPVPGGVKAGMISKPNGLQGKVNMILNPQAGKLIKTESPLFINLDGQRVPFFVEELEFVSFDMAIVKFEFIDSVEKAREISGCEVYLDTNQKAVSQNDTSDFSRLIGFEAHDQETGYLGKVTDYIASDKNPVLVIEFERKELLVPAVKALIQDINYDEQSIHFNLPDGLTTL